MNLKLLNQGFFIESQGRTLPSSSNSFKLIFLIYIVKPGLNEFRYRYDSVEL